MGRYCVSIGTEAQADVYIVYVLVDSRPIHHDNVFTSKHLDGLFVEIVLCPLGNLELVSLWFLVEEL